MATVFDSPVQLVLRPVKDYAELPRTVHSVQMQNRRVVVELVEGEPGDQGPEGPSAWPWIWQGDIATPAALTALSAAMGIEEIGYAWRVVSTNVIRYWNGEQFYEFTAAFQQPGNRGADHILTGSAVTGAVGTNASATLTGTAPNKHLTITGPRGVTGDVGDPGLAGAILESADVGIAQRDAFGDMVLEWDTPTNKFVGSPYPGWAGPWALGSGDFSGGSNIATATKRLASITIPPLGYSWRPVFWGGVSLATHIKVARASRVDLVVRMDSETGEVVGRGFGSGGSSYYVPSISEHFASALVPGSNVGVIPANTQQRFYVMAERAYGKDKYSVQTDFGNLIVMAAPA